MSEIIVITSGKGGVGKTTTTANLGVGLAMRGKKVVLIDTDTGLRNLDLLLGLENRIMYDLIDVTEGRVPYKKALVRHKKHVERTKVIIHVLDASGIEGRDPVEDYHKINKELKRYSERIARRPQVIAANKMDLPQARENYEKIEKLAAAEGVKIFPISAAANDGLRPLMECVAQMLEAYVEEPEAEEKTAVYEAKDEDEVTISRDISGDFVVASKSLEKLVAMTNFGNDEAVRRFQYIWRIKGIEEKLKDKGIKEGDTVHIGDMEFEYRQ